MLLFSRLLSYRFLIGSCPAASLVRACRAAFFVGSCPASFVSGLSCRFFCRFLSCRFVGVLPLFLSVLVLPFFCRFLSNRLFCRFLSCFSLLSSCAAAFFSVPDLPFSCRLLSCCFFCRFLSWPFLSVPILSSAFFLSAPALFLVFAVNSCLAAFFWSVPVFPLFLSVPFLPPIFVGPHPVAC